MEKAGGALDELVARYPVLASCRADIEAAFALLARTFAAGGRLLVCGNGGSAADADHIVGELMKGFRRPRRLSGETAARFAASDPELGPRLASRLQLGLPAVNLAAGSALPTAFANDEDPGLVFAQQVLVLGRPGDALLGISTSGNAANVIAALVAARAVGMAIVGLTGRSGGRMQGRCDVLVAVPGSRAFEVQELHLPVYHCLCAMLEDRFFPE
ncbi:MAG: phosphoheptose isomerase [Spirochaetes bacterium RBG_13_68_11]|nr:MAG: phosphoheptose isomerase [Spirochaetes bacterium RBG_13_68_11]